MRSSPKKKKPDLEIISNLDSEASTEEISDTDDTEDISDSDDSASDVGSAPAETLVVQQYSTYSELFVNLISMFIVGMEGAPVKNRIISLRLLYNTLMRNKRAMNVNVPMLEPFRSQRTKPPNISVENCHDQVARGLKKTLSDRYFEAMNQEELEYYTEALNKILAQLREKTYHI